MEKKQSVTLTIPFLPLLTLILVFFKLNGTIDWSWWWVWAPMWVPVAIVLGVMALLGIVVIVGEWIINKFK